MATKFESGIELETFRDFLSTIPRGFDEVCMKVTSEGLYMEGIDRAHILMVKIRLESKIFDWFKTDDAFEIVFDVVCVKSFINVLKSKMITFEIKNKTKLRMETDNLTYDLRLFNTLDSNKPSELPEFEFDDGVTLSTKNFQSYINAAKKIDSHLNMGLRNGGFYIESKTKNDALIVELSKDEMSKLDDEHAIDLESSFGTDYLVDIAKAVQSLEYIRLNLKNKYLLKVEGGRNGINVEYLLAPVGV